MIRLPQKGPVGRGHRHRLAATSNNGKMQGVERQASPEWQAQATADPVFAKVKHLPEFKRLIER